MTRTGLLRAVTLAAILGLGLWLVGATTRPAYQRSLYRHWIDANKDCRDTRTEVLIRDAVNYVETWGQSDPESAPTGLVLSDDRCRVVTGRWKDPYSGQVLLSPTEIDVDHVISLKDAHERGGWRWTPAQRAEYANRLTYRYHLLAVSASLNRQKGAKDASQWVPPDKAFHCRFGEIRATIAVLSGLDVTRAEREAIRALVATC